MNVGGEGGGAAAVPLRPQASPVSGERAAQLIRESPRCSRCLLFLRVSVHLAPWSNRVRLDAAESPSLVTLDHEGALCSAPDSPARRPPATTCPPVEPCPGAPTHRSVAGWHIRSPAGSCAPSCGFERAEPCEVPAVHCAALLVHDRDCMGRGSERAAPGAKRRGDHARPDRSKTSETLRRTR